MIATTRSSTRKTALPSASRLRLSRRQASAQRLVCSRASVSPTYAWGVATPGAVAISLLLVADSGIDRGVQQVDKQVGQADCRRIEREDADHDVVVARKNALDEFLAQPGDAEDVLDHHAAGDDADR